MPDIYAVIKMLRKAGVEVYTREQWGTARESSYASRRATHPMASTPARCHFLHITVTADTDSVREGAAGARQVESYGLSSPPMVSYQDLITNEGKYYQGQNYGTKGTHTINDKRVPNFPYDLNLYGYALAIMQNVEDAVTDEQVLLAAQVFAARELTGWVFKGASVHPHRMFAEKSCPGDKAVARLHEITDLKNNMVARGSIRPFKPKPSRGEHVDAALANLMKTKAEGQRRRYLINEAKRTLRKIPFIKS